MRVLKNDHKKFCDAIDSAPARYDRILDSHPYITKRPTSELTFGYIIDYPKVLFRCEYIIHLLYHHIEICNFNQHALESFVKLRCMASGLKRVYNVGDIFKQNSAPFTLCYSNTVFQDYMFIGAQESYLLEFFKCEVRLLKNVRLFLQSI